MSSRSFPAAWTSLAVAVPSIAAALLASTKNEKPSLLDSSEPSKPNKFEAPRLLQTHIVFRHGARTPVFWDNSIEGLDASAFRGKCEAVNLPPGVAGSHAYPLIFKAAQLDVRDVNGVRLRRPRSVVDAFQLQAIYAECRAGQLTTKGVEQSAKLGQELKARYGPIAQQARKENKLWVRTSNVARCVATLQFVLGEFFFEEDAKNSDEEEEQAFVTLTSPNQTEWLYPNNNCSLMAQLMFAARQDWSRDPGPEARAVVEKLRNRLSEQTFKAMKLDGFNFVRIRDYLVSYEEHGLPRPWIDDDDELVKQVERLGAEQIARYLYHDNDDMSTVSARAGVGNLLKIIFNAVLHPGNTTARVSIVSAHDTTLIPILSACRAWDGVWPGFCSWIAFELWSDDLVRLVFNGKVARTYSLKEFEALAERLAPKDGEPWEEYCKQSHPSIPPLEPSKGGPGDHF